jgi:hypothetical protein
MLAGPHKCITTRTSLSCGGIKFTSSLSTHDQVSRRLNWSWRNFMETRLPSHSQQRFLIIPNQKKLESYVRRQPSLLYSAKASTRDGSGRNCGWQIRFFLALC